MNSALRVDSTFLQYLSVDLCMLVEVLGSLQTFLEALETMVGLAMLGFIMSIRHWSWFTFWKTLPISAKGGKAYTNLWAQDIWKASLPWLKGSIFHDMYWGNWCDTLEANRSICGVPLIWHNFMKMVEFSFHSLESLVCLDSLSTSTFIDPCKYLAVIVIFRFKRYCQISLLIAKKLLISTPGFWYSPFLLEFKNYKMSE